MVECISNVTLHPIKNILFNGGWPELYTNTSLATTTYLNNYLRSYVEKDIVLSAGTTECLTLPIAQLHDYLLQLN